MVSFIKRTDWRLFIAACGLTIAGLLSLASNERDFFWKQIAWTLCGLLCAFILSYIDLRSFFSRKSIMIGIYSVGMALLIATYFFAPVVKGNRAWIFIGPFQFQPSEFMKVALVIVLAYFFSRRHVGIAHVRTLLESLVIAGIPAIAIALQPEMGSALLLCALWFGFVVISGLPWKHITVFALIGVVCFAGMWLFVLKDYQKDRIINVIYPNADPLGASYNVIQSKIAIGSGGFFGKGFSQGTQVQLGFLPEAHNDFIFSAITEEGGLFAACSVVILFLWMIKRLLSIGQRVEGNTTRFICAGTAILFTAQFVVNIGSTMGLLPVIGVTLPFVSYGGSSILASWMLIGIVQSMYTKQ